MSSRTDYQREYARKRREAQRAAQPPKPPGRPAGEPTKFVQARVPPDLAQWVEASGGLRVVLERSKRGRERIVESLRGIAEVMELVGDPCSPDDYRRVGYSAGMSKALAYLIEE